jgi:DNA-binding CsgD family transcriptional regulator
MDTNYNAQNAGRAAVPGLSATYGLLPRETEVAGWVAQGKTNPEIAIILQISPRTVEKHMERVLQKLGVENRTAAAVIISHAADARDSH